MVRLNWAKRICVAVLFCAATAVALSAQTLTTLFSFEGAPTSGSYPHAALVQATDGNLYGVTNGGGANANGSIFKISPSGTLTTVYSFCAQSNCTDGKYPEGALVQDINGIFYGTTDAGGANDSGTVFKITPSGTLTTLYSFCAQTGCPDGQYPEAGLVKATNGLFYGTTDAGGANGDGAVFSITPGGTLTTLYSFCSQSGCTDGKFPEAGLAQGTNGSLYGTTDAGGVNDGGTVFKITPSGALTTLYSFCAQSGCVDGEYPEAGLVLATNASAFYGTTDAGGVNNDGTVFKITPSGALSTLYSFCSVSGCGDGKYPEAGLVQATDGNYYGTTDAGGANDGGAAFQITPTGTLTKLYSFCSQSSCADGQYPEAGLVQETNGNLYGTTYQGGAGSACTGNCGTVFSLAVGLGPFVETEPTSGPVGRPVRILGTYLAKATSVTFNGTSATFKVVSSSEITTTVPVGATTGLVEVVTPGGTLASNVPFRVRP